MDTLCERAPTVFSGVPILMAADKPCPQLHTTFLSNVPLLTNFQTPIDITSLSSPTSASGQSSNNLVPNVMRNQNTKYSRLATTGSPSRDSTKTNSVSSTQELLQNQIRQQEHLVNHQDAQLSQMSQSVGTLRNMSSAIGSELDEQAVMLDEFGSKNQTQTPMKP